MTNEVASAVNKAKEGAKKHIFKCPLIKGTIPHQINVKYGSVKLMLKPASPGTGIIAGGPIRAACDVVGIKDIVAKSLGSSNPINVLRACMKGLKSQKTPKYIAAQRGKKIAEIIKRKQ